MVFYLVLLFAYVWVFVWFGYLHLILNFGVPVVGSVFCFWDVYTGVGVVACFVCWLPMF